MIDDAAGPFKECIAALPKDVISGLKVSCTFDMCALEGDATQNDFRCKVYNTFAATCYEFSQKNDKKWSFADWREKTNCRNYLNLQKY